MANSFLGNGSVESREIILTKNDKYKICRGHLGLFKYEKRGVAEKRGQTFWNSMNIGRVFFFRKIIFDDKQKLMRIATHLIFFPVKAESPYFSRKTRVLLFNKKRALHLRKTRV